MPLIQHGRQITGRLAWTRTSSVYTMHMARINIYVPDELAEEAKRSGLNVSSLAQRAIRASLAAQSTDQWLRTLRPAPPHTSTHESVVRALDAARDEAPTRHG